MTGLTWRPVRSDVAHAFRANSGGRSVCGLVQAPEHAAGGQLALFDLPSDRDPRPTSRRCRLCQRGLRRGGPAELPHDPTARGTCGCSGCRESRAEWSARYAEFVGDDMGICRCVLTWPGARSIVDEATAAWAAELLTWEASGARIAVQDTHEAERFLVDAWREAERLYELLDGSHPHHCGPRKGGPR